MEQSSLLGPEHGVLVMSGSVEDGITYRIRRDDGTTMGEDEILTLADEDVELTEDVRALVSSPDARGRRGAGRRGVEYVVLAAPADGASPPLLDATAGLDQASAEDRATRAWRVDRPLDPEARRRDRAWWRTALLVVQGLAILVALVLAAPDRDGSDDVADRRRAAPRPPTAAAAGPEVTGRRPSPLTLLAVAHPAADGGRAGRSSGRRHAGHRPRPRPGRPRPRRPPCARPGCRAPTTCVLGNTALVSGDVALRVGAEDATETLDAGVAARDERA